MFNLSLNESQINIVLGSLGKQPAETTMDVILSIKKQCESQIMNKPDNKKNIKIVDGKKAKNNK